MIRPARQSRASSFSNSENLPRSGFRLRSTPRSVFRLRCSFRFCPKNPAEAMRWGAHRFRSWVSSRKNPSPGQRRRSASDAVLAVSLTFHHSHALPSILAWAQDCHTQSWRGHRIAPPNPAVATGLLHPILLWQQDCSTQSCCGNRIAPPNPAVATGLPRCFPENAGSAVLYSTTPPDSPPGLRGKHRQCVGTHRCTPGLAARIARKKPAAMP